MTESRDDENRLYSSLNERRPEDLQEWDSGDYETYFAEPEDDLESQEVEFELDPEEEHEPYEAGTPEVWHYDHSGFYAYVVLDTAKDRVRAIVDLLESSGISCLSWGPSRRPADNGKTYQWYVRVGNESASEPHAHPGVVTVAQAMNGLEGFSAEDEPTDLQQLVTRVDELDRQHSIQRRRYETRLKELQDRYEVAEAWRRKLSQRTKDLRSDVERSRQANAELSASLKRMEQSDQQSSEAVKELQRLREQNAGLQDDLQTVLEGYEEDIEKQESKQEELRRGKATVEEQLQRAEQENEDRTQELERQLRRAAQGSETSRHLAAHLTKTLECTLPELTFLNPGSVEVLANEVRNYEHALAQLRVLETDPQSIVGQARAVRSAKSWRETRFKDGVQGKHRGRLYFRKSEEGEPGKYVVHVGLKNTQDSDIKLLKKNELII